MCWSLQSRATKVGKGLGGRSWDKRLRAPGWRRGGCGEALRRGGTERGTSICSLGTNIRIYGNVTELCLGRLSLDIRTSFCIVRVLRHWHRLPWEVVGAPGLPEFKGHLENALSDVL